MTIHIGTPYDRHEESVQMAPVRDDGDVCMAIALSSGPVIGVGPARLQETR